MKKRDIITILCSELGHNTNIVPLTPSEWPAFESTLAENGIGLENFVRHIDDYREIVWKKDKITWQRLKCLLSREVNLGFELAEYTKVGIGILTLADTEYPYRVKEKITTVWPPIFYYAGNLQLLGKRNRYVGFVGSRNVGTRDFDFVQNVITKLPLKYGVVSGGAMGVDTSAIDVALSQGRNVVVYVSDNLMGKLRNKQYIKAIHEGRMLMLSAAIPRAGFTVGMAMARNKLIYVQSEFTVVVKSYGKGGTWKGATENLSHGWVPMLCWNNDNYEENRELIAKGAIPIDEEWDGNLKFLTRSDECTKTKKEHVYMQDSLFSYLGEQSDDKLMVSDVEQSY